MSAATDTDRVDRIHLLTDAVVSAPTEDDLQLSETEVKALADPQLTVFFYERKAKLEGKVSAELKAAHETLCMSIIAGCHDGDELRTTVVEKLRPMVANSAALADKLARAMSSRYVSITGAKGTWTTRTIAKLLREVPRSALPASVVELTHVGVAQTIIKEYDGNLLRVVDYEKNSWLQWDGCRWLPLTDCEVGTLVAERLDAHKVELSTDAALDEKAYREAARTLGHISFNHGVCGAMGHQRAAHVRLLQLDQARDYLTVANGAVHIPSGELVANRELLLTLENSVEYVADANCPVFLKTLDTMFPRDTEDREWFELALGYTMVGLPTEKAIFVHKGDGDNGKSLLLNAISAAMGAHATTSPDALVAGDERSSGNGDGNGPSPMLHNLKNRRMTYVDEIEDGKVLRDGFVRQIASGLGQLSGRRLGGQLEHFPMMVVVHISCNNLARVRGGHRAVFNRLCPVVYSKQFDETQQDVTLPERLAQEKEGIFNWLLGCAREYLELKASGTALKNQMPPSARAELETLRREQSNLEDWIEESCIVAPSAFINPADAAMSFNEFVRRFDKDSRAVFRSPKGFVSRMKTERMTGIHHAEQIETEQRRGNRQSGFVGLTLKTSPQYVMTTPRKVSRVNGVPHEEMFNRPS